MSACRSTVVCEGFDALFGAIVDMYHLAVVDVVGVSGDLLKELEVLADQRGHVFDRIDMGWARHQAASCRVVPAGDQFHGSSSGSLDTEMLGIRARTSASQACGSTSFILPRRSGNT